MLGQRMVQTGTGGGGGGSPPAPPTFVAAADSSTGTASTSHSVTIPSHSNGDLLVLAFAQTAASTTPASATDTPSGWSTVTNGDAEAGNASAVRLTVFTKTGDGAESSVSVSTGSTSTGFGATCAAYSGASGTVNVAANTTQESGTDMTAPEVTTTVDNCTVIHCFVFDDDVPTEADVDSDAGFQGTLRGYEEQSLPGNGLAMAYSDLEQASQGGSGTCVFSTNADTDAGVAITLAIESS